MGRRQKGPRLIWEERKSLYYIAYNTDGRSRTCSTGLANRAKAEEFFSEWLLRHTRPERAKEPSAVMIAEALSAYAVSVEDTPGAVRVGYAIPNLLKYFPGRTLADISPASCARYHTNRKRSAGTSRRELGILSAAVGYAFQQGIVDRRIVVHRPSSPPPREVFLTKNEIAKLIRGARRSSKASRHLPLFILIAFYTCRRRAAILELTWDKIDLDKGTIDFRRSDKVENKKRRGVCVIPRKLLVVLKAFHKNQQIGPVINFNGKPIGNIVTAFNKAVKASGLSKHITPHTIKHSGVSYLLNSGAPIWKVSKFTETSVETLSRTYGHADTTTQEEVARVYG